MGHLVAAVDVGTGSARAGILDRRGKFLGRAEHPIEMNRHGAGRAEHDSEQIWQAVGLAMREALREAGVPPEDVAGISFDATCSLVVRDGQGRQLNLSGDDDPRWDTIVWMDHRAREEAEECTASGHRVVDHAGGTMSPEMQIPKVMWLRRRSPDIWKNIGYLFDLADFLTWKACGSLERSQCTLACKWGFLPEHGGWPVDFLSAMGLSDLREKAALPEKASPAGTDLGPLSDEAARVLGLTARCRVGIGLVDGHAGFLGILGRAATEPETIHRRFGLIAGTSSCVMALSKTPRFSRSVWGPHYGALLPDYWLIEGGQSASGALLDHIIQNHAAGGEPTPGRHHEICRRIAVLRAGEGPDLGGRIHVLPDFHGNRSPYADPDAIGVISGLTLDSSFAGLCRLYWRTAVAIALGIRQIVETLTSSGYEIDALHMAGGHSKNPILMRLYADATGLSIFEPTTEDAVLLGTAIVAAVAAGFYEDLASASHAMAQDETEHLPDGATRRRLDRDYRIFLAMQEHRREIDGLT